MIIVFEPRVFCDSLDYHIALSKFSISVGSTTANTQNPHCEIFANPQDPDCEMIDASDKIMNSFLVLRVRRNRKECMTSYWKIFGISNRK